MDAELMCGVCLELFENPLMLPCSHNFCKKCIAGILQSREQQSQFRYSSSSRSANSLFCPLCQRKIRLESGIDTLPINRTLENIITIYKEGPQTSVTQFNDLFWNMQSEIAESICKIHSNPMSLYCLSCNLAVCQSCTCVIDKSSGVSHRCIDIKEYTYQTQAKISEKLTEIKKKCSPLHDRIQLIEDVLTGIDDNEKKVSKQLELECGTLIACIRSRQEELNRKLHNDILEIKRPIDEQLRKHKTLYNSVQDCLKKLSLVKGTKDQSLKIKLMQESERQLNSLLCFDLAWFSLKESPMINMPTWKLVKTGVEEAMSKLELEKIDNKKETELFPRLSDNEGKVHPQYSLFSKKGSNSSRSSPVDSAEMSKIPASQFMPATFSQNLATFTFNNSVITKPTFTTESNQGSSVSTDQAEFNISSSVTSATTSSKSHGSDNFTTLSTFSVASDSGHSAFSAVASGGNPFLQGLPSSSAVNTTSVNRGSLPGNFIIPKASDFVPAATATSNVSLKNKSRNTKRSDALNSGQKSVSSSQPAVDESDIGLPVTCVKTSNKSMVSFSVAAAAEPSVSMSGTHIASNVPMADSGMASGPIVHSVAMETNTASSQLEGVNVSSNSLPQKSRSDMCTSAFTVKAPSIGSSENDARNISSSHVIKPSVTSQSDVLPSFSNLSLNTRRHSADYVSPNNTFQFPGNANFSHRLSEVGNASKFSKQFVIPKNTNFSINIPVSLNSSNSASKTNSNANANIVILPSTSKVTKPNISNIARPSSDSTLRRSDSQLTGSDSGSDMEVSQNIEMHPNTNIPFNTNIPLQGSQNFPQLSSQDFTSGQAQPRSSSPGKPIRRVIRAKKPKK